MRTRGQQLLIRALAAGAVAGAVAGFAPRAIAADAPIRIELRAEAVVTGPQVRLGDVAILTTLDPVILERLAGLSIGPAPRTESHIRVDREHLARWLRIRAGIPPSEIAWAGADVSVVRSAVERVPGKMIADRAEQELEEVLSASSLYAKAELAEIPRDAIVPAGSLELRPRALPHASLLSRRPSVWVDLRVDGRFVRSVPVAFELTIYGPADGAVRAEPAPLLHRGSWATLRDHDGLLTLERKVQLVDEGREGQAVRVRAAGERRTILTRITGADSVEVAR